MTWSDASERYRRKLRRETRKKTQADTASRLAIAERIFDRRRTSNGLSAGATLRECINLASFEYLQDQLLDGAESRKDSRSVNTVNGFMGTIMAFVRYCKDHGWIDEVPRVRKLNAGEVMKGRPITGEEYDRFVAATPRIVGEGPANSWKFTIEVLWESAFRVQDVMEFSWNDPNYIHPVWPKRPDQHPTIVIPPAQKNGKHEEIPMLPGLADLLDKVPPEQRSGWVVNPEPVEYTVKNQSNWFVPTDDDLAGLIPVYTNTAIAQACGVSEQAVRKWLKRRNLTRSAPATKYGEAIPDSLKRRLLANANQKNVKVRTHHGRLTGEHVSKIISDIGREAGIVVKSPRRDEGDEVKYASTHDVRRGVAQRLINSGITAETLKVVMRHRDFATTERFYGATRQAQSAAAEIHEKLSAGGPKSELVGQTTDVPKFSPSEMRKLKSLLNSL